MLIPVNPASAVASEFAAGWGDASLVETGVDTVLLDSCVHFSAVSKNSAGVMSAGSESADSSKVVSQSLAGSVGSGTISFQR